MQKEEEKRLRDTDKTLKWEWKIRQKERKTTEHQEEENEKTVLYSLD